MRIYRNFHYICYDPGTGAVFYIWPDKKENLETDADFFLAGSEDCEEYSADFYSDRNYDRSVESEWFHYIYCLLCIGNMRTVDHAAGIISFMFSGIFSDRNCIWNSSYHGCDLHDNGEKHECFRCPGRRCNSCGNLFWRQMFAGFY